MYTIKRAAEQVGISAATLRAWERRYGIVAPTRSDGGYRLYDEKDVRALALMAQLVNDGWTPSLAAGEATRRLEAEAAQDKRPRPAVPLGVEDSPRAQPSSAAFAEVLVEAGAALDAEALAAALDEMFAVGSFEAVVDQHLMPAMGGLGAAWAAGRISVAGEHFVSNAVQRRLAAGYEAAASFASGPPVLVGLGPGGRHELGLLAFAVAARRRGLATDYLGADLPVADWVSAARERGPAALVLAVPTPDDVEQVAAVVAAVRRARPDLLIAVGGAEQDRAPAQVLRLGHDIGTGAALLATSLGRAAAGLAAGSGSPQ
ncbi:transcriptional regulator [Intrasporangium chromatireducens Q5-1]|uniref:Transcriptional regulator n=1 Tax=Intrasporangium chromatireducens Q5-1 TaxID=584657 RepID=W9GL81_9MICO|nr:MerR family transcriptional regulator [Intrasporangium chromatireducens]EWT06870.1 transcriptional regulator [Intrasporangium chromatireducens Q5-1]